MPSQPNLWSSATINKLSHFYKVMLIWKGSKVLLTFWKYIKLKMKQIAEENSKLLRHGFLILFYMANLVVLAPRTFYWMLVYVARYFRFLSILYIYSSIVCSIRQKYHFLNDLDDFKTFNCHKSRIFNIVQTSPVMK